MILRLFMLTIVYITFLSGCVTMGHRAGYRAGMRYYFENKDSIVSSYAWGFHVGWVEAQTEWTRMHKW